MTTGTSVLYVSTVLDAWETSALGFDQAAICEHCGYRRLDPEYYAWLRSRMEVAKQAWERGQLVPLQYQELRRRFNEVHIWAARQFGEEKLLAAVRSLDPKEYHPPKAWVGDPRPLRIPERKSEQRSSPPAHCKSCREPIDFVKDCESNRWIAVRPDLHQEHICRSRIWRWDET